MNQSMSSTQTRESGYQVFTESKAYSFTLCHSCDCNKFHMVLKVK